jgi:hypothetical protein
MMIGKHRIGWALSLGFVLGMLGLLFFHKGFKAAKSHYYSCTYIKEIDLPTLDGNAVADILERFNAMGGGRIVKIKGCRPVTIKEGRLMSFNPGYNTLGVTISLPKSCQIVLDNKFINSYKELRATVLHEYLHCFDYEHVRPKNDLMSFSDNDTVSEENIESYAKDLERKLHGSK